MLELSVVLPKSLVRIVLVVMMLATAPALQAADMPESPHVAIEAGDTAAIVPYVKKRAILHVLRATFDVESLEDLESSIRADLANAQSSGVTEDEVADLDTDLIAEGSYFIVGLRYLIDAGFPAWPQDRPEATYRRDAVAILDPLPGKLIASIAAGDDPGPILAAASKVFWWTEGALAPLNGRANFSFLDVLIAAAVHAAGTP